MAVYSLGSGVSFKGGGIGSDLFRASNLTKIREWLYMNVLPDPAAWVSQQVNPFLPCTFRCGWWRSSSQCYATTPDDVTRVFNAAVEHFHIRERRENDPIQSEFTVTAIKGRAVVWQASCKPHKFPEIKIHNSRSGDDSTPPTPRSPVEEDNSQLHVAYATRFSQLSQRNPGTARTSHTDPVEPQDNTF